MKFGLNYGEDILGVASKPEVVSEVDLRMVDFLVILQSSKNCGQVSWFRRTKRASVFLSLRRVGEVLMNDFPDLHSFFLCPLEAS